MSDYQPNIDLHQMTTLKRGQGDVMGDFATVPVKTYRVVNDWLNKTLLETRDFDEACEAKAHHEALNQHDEIIVVAVDRKSVV